MSYASIQIGTTRLDVISLRMARPLSGRWRATLEIDAGAVESVAEGSATLTIGDRTLTGYITAPEPAPVGGRAHVEMRGGAGGWSTVVRARDYLDVLPRTVVAHLAADAGETIDVDSLEALPLTVIGRWARAEGPAGNSLSILLRRLGLSWRLLDSGETWIGAESWPAAPASDVLVEAAYGDDGALCVVPPGMTIEPGTMWTDERQIDRVIYTLAEGGQLRAELLFARAVGPDLERALFERAVRAVLRELPFLRRYPARVAAQGEGGDVELVPDSQGQAGTPPIPVLYGLPGCRAEVEAGARVGLVYEDGDPSAPRALGWEQSTPATLLELEADSIKLGASAERGVVRLDDLGDGGTWTAVGPSLTYTSPDGTTAWTITALADVVTGIVSWTIVPVTGNPGALVTKAIRASSKVRAE